MEYITNKRNLYLIGIFAIAFSVRIIANILFQGLNSPQNPGFPDYIAYLKIAKSIAFEGYFGYDGVLTTRFPPGAPFLIACIFKVFGVNYLILRTFYCFIGATTCLLLYFVCLNFAKKQTLALTAALILALYPPQIYSSMHFGTEVPLLLLLTALFLIYYRAKSDMKNVSFIYLGVILCLTIYTHAALLIFIPIITILLLLFENKIFKKKFILISVPLCVILLLPWSYRNSTVSGQIAATSTHGGSTLWDGNNPITYNDTRFKGSDTGALLAILEKDKKLDTIKGYEEYKDIENTIQNRSENSYTSATIKYIRNNLSKLPEIIIWKLYRGLSPTHESPNRTVNMAFYATFFFANIFGLLGLILVASNIANYNGSILLFSQLVFFVLVTMIFFGLQRYRILMNPSEIIFTAVGLVWTIERLGIIKTSRVGPRFRTAV